MPRPTGDRTTYLPGIDGVRTLAVGLVICYHVGVKGVPGGLLGVGVFFTLSGFLITGVLLDDRLHSGKTRLGRFWYRRARRLLPALVAMLAVVLIATFLTDVHSLAKRGWQALFGLFYVFNWTTIAGGQSYFDRQHGPGPLDHIWSLAVEEQFYVLWPLVLLVLVAICRGRFRQVAVITLVLAAASFVLLSVLAVPGFDNTRAYEGTDTRAGGLLIGAVLALLWRGFDSSTARRSTRAVADLAGLLGVVVIVALAVGTTQYDMGIYHWGLVAISVASAALVGAVAIPGTLLSRLFGLAPLRWLGERSYGIYLWHLPVIVFAPAKWLADMPVVRDVALAALSVVIAAVSWAWLEEPIRQRGFGVFTRGRRSMAGGWVRPGFAGFLPVAVLAVLVPLVVKSLVPATMAPAHAAAPPQQHIAPAASHRPLGPTRCTSAIHIGDSTSQGMIQSYFLPNAADREPAQMAKVGVKNLVTEIKGGRSISDPAPQNTAPPAVQDIQMHLNAGFKGCWIIAMGTNDVANASVGDGAPADQRVKMIMDLLKDQPVMWVDSWTQLTDGPWSQQNMIKWNNLLAQACKQYPKMRVYDWRAEAQPQWFGSDGIHYKESGWRERTKHVARALAATFPKHGPDPKGCFTRTE